MEEIKVHQSGRGGNRMSQIVNQNANVQMVENIRIVNSEPTSIEVNPNAQPPILSQTNLNAALAETVDGRDAVDRLQVTGSYASYTDRDGKHHQKKTQSLSDPTASPAQRSTRSRTSIEKSPRRKRSKSESRRRRERKMIAAGELEVKQANETLMKYLRQCTEINDASLSGELEIDKSLEDRRVHRKTKSQRERRILQTGKPTIRDQGSPAGGLTTILNNLVEDIIPNNGEIYNPFTPVISPTDGPPMRIDKMFIQTGRGYRSVDNLYKQHEDNDPDNDRQYTKSVQSLSCDTQHTWTLFSNVCHGLLGGLALAHLLFILTTRPYEWVDLSVANYFAFAETYHNTFFCLAVVCMVSIFDR